MAGSETYIPLVSSLDKIYSTSQTLAKEGARWDNLMNEFERQYGKKPDFVARAPGRVNIIGEHVDHQGFSVLPAAIEMDILMVVKITPAKGGADDSKVKFVLSNTTPRFERATFETEFKQGCQDVLLNHEGGDRWANYFKVAVKGLHPHLPPATLSPSTRPALIEVLVNGTIPPESSLSSSAAMTSCSSIVVLEAFGARNLISRREMAEVAIESERLVGVNSGGMDQAASIFGVPGHALHIEFYPELKATPTRMPKCDPSHTFVIANTLIVSDKKVTGPIHYNLRTVELRLASRAIAKKLDLPMTEATAQLNGLLRAFYEKNSLPTGDAGVEQARKEAGDEGARIFYFGRIAEDAIPKEAVTRVEAEKLTGYSGTAYDDEFLSRFPIRGERFELYKRAHHVFDEALRTLRFRKILGDATAAQSMAADGGAAQYAQLGKMLDDCHTSMRDFYQASCPELETVVQIAKQNGALGSRLTGAGWGGSTVSLVPSAQVPRLLDALKEGYFKKRFPDITQEKIDQSLLATEPAGGACVYAIAA
ncbi:Galactokinase [Tilletiaria anomala UBC 951]|uniref:Galactokinase n=1 Tax=Tilletiaria anomala (strain ATCC 24038 / CBS 436.72 / UBC 951) TaxID=1037660 RepID=A0A066V950_TILAU|nr:Galactokinase [Tilletiaria anomala UBC 951]KDN38267.1 Galactokinase [Tilletiaria anomala UBC 951]